MIVSYTDYGRRFIMDQPSFASGLGNPLFFIKPGFAIADDTSYYQQVKTSYGGTEYLLDFYFAFDGNQQKLFDSFDVFDLTYQKIASVVAIFVPTSAGALDYKDDQFYLSDGRDDWYDGGGTDYVDLAGGDDIYHYASGQDKVLGGSGFDLVAVAGLGAGLALRSEDDWFQIRSANGEMLFATKYVERVAFEDVTVAFDVSGGAGQMYRLYQAAFARDPDAEGLGYWIREYDQGGKGLAGVAFDFMRSDEFKARYGSPDAVSDEAFLNLLYQNVLGRGPDAGGRAYWMDELADGFPRENLLASFSESLENQNLVAAEIQNGIWFI